MKNIKILSVKNIKRLHAKNIKTVPAKNIKVVPSYHPRPKPLHGDQTEEQSEVGDSNHIIEDIPYVIKIKQAEKIARQESKHKLLLNFLASGEVWTTTAVVSQLLGMGKFSAKIMLHWLVERSLLNVDRDAVPFSKQNIWGISKQGLLMVDSTLQNCPEFTVGTTSPHVIADHIDIQLIRLSLERMGWTSFVRSNLYVHTSNHLSNKYNYNYNHAMLATRNDGLRVAIAIERHVRSLYRLKAEIEHHLLQLHEGKYDLVYFFTPNKTELERALHEVTAVRSGGRGMKFNDRLKGEFFFIIEMNQLNS